MLKKLKTELYTYYKMTLLAIMSVAGIVLMGQSQVAQNLLSGLAIFLLGMLFLEDGFKGFSGGILERILKKFSNTKLKSILFGMITTAVMQSSTLVTILTLSFLSASLVGLGQALGIVFGANIGSTTSGWIIAGVGVKMNVSALGLPLITLGVLLLFAKSKNLKSLGYILAGVGFFFLGISYIKTGFEGYQNAFSLNATGFGKVGTFVVFFLMGILITSIVQSSFATLTIIILALSAGSINYDDALALVIGTNVGGVVTALVASISSNVNGRRLAIGNTLFNLVIAAVCIVLLPIFKDIVEFLSELFGFSEDNYALKIALFHTSYNVIAVIIMAPFIPVFEKFLCTFITTSKDDSDTAHYINLNLIPYQNTAKESLQKEVMHLFDNTITILSAVLGVSKQKILESKLTKQDFVNIKVDPDDLESLYEKKIKNIFNAIIDFCAHLRASYSDDSTFIREVSNLQKASQSLVEATKNLKIIKFNLSQNSHSSNLDFQDQYLHIKALLADTIYRLRCFQEETSDLLELQNKIKQLRKELKQEEKSTIRSVELLLKDNKISSAQATSVLNDIAFSIKSLKEIIAGANCIAKYQILLISTKDEVEDSQSQQSSTSELQDVPNPSPSQAESSMAQSTQISQAKDMQAPQNPSIST